MIEQGKRTQTRRKLMVLIVMTLAVCGWSWWSDFSTSQSDMPTKDAKTVDTADPDSLVKATVALGQLSIQERASHEGYSRDKFSDDWAEVEGCDMRNRILQRDLENIVVDDDGCTVLSGILTDDPYTGSAIQFMRGRSTSSAVQIDHVVAVSDAWQKGAQKLTYEQRHDFYNDPLNLIAVDGPANTTKSNSDAAEWLPQGSYQCRYIARQIAVKLKYELWVTTSEHSAMQRVLGSCSGQLLPIESPDAP